MDASLRIVSRASPARPCSSASPPSPSGQYNYRITGDPLTIPYQINEAGYSLAPEWILTASEPEQKTYRHTQIRRYHERRL